MTCSSKKKMITKKWRRSYKDITVTGAVEGHIVDNEIFVISYEGLVAHHPGWTTCQVKIHKYEVQLKAHHSLIDLFHSGEMSFAQATANVSLWRELPKAQVALVRLLKVASSAQSCSKLLHSDQTSTRTSQTEMQVHSLSWVNGPAACSRS